MKTPEDEAFDELAKRQGAWGGGFKAKQAMAADKMQEPVRDLDGHVVRDARKRVPKPKAQPAQEPDMQTGIAYQKGFHDGKQAALAQPAKEPVSFPCCGYTDANAIRWNQGVVQCHMCGQVYTVAQPAQEPVARVTGVYGGRFTYEPINPAMILPVGMALYAGPA